MLPCSLNVSGLSNKKYRQWFTTHGRAAASVPGMSTPKINTGLLTTFLLVWSLPFFAQKEERIYADTLQDIATDSFSHDLGNIPMVNNKLTKPFIYTGTDTLFIIRTWTGDPHYICEYPKEAIVKGKTYAFTVCFWNEGRPGLFNKTMGFELSNGKRIVFVFKGQVLRKE